MLRKIITRCYVGIMMVFMGSIFLRFFTLNILIEKLNINNAFTEFVFFDVLLLQERNKNIDWAGLYPFSDNNNDKRNRIDILKNKIVKVEKKIDGYTNENLVGRIKFVEVAIKYEKAVGWNILNGNVIHLGNGYFAEVIEKIRGGGGGIETLATALYEFDDFLENLGIGFLYVQCPYNISRNDTIVSASDFSNENTDALLHALSLKDVPYFDLRKNISEEFFDYHSLFYKTDVHWKVETGLWAAKTIGDYLNGNYGFKFDLNLLSPVLYRHDIYKDWFLGPLGKKATLVQIPPEDFTLVYPGFDTDFLLKIPDLGIDVRGDFNIFLNHNMIDAKDYYRLYPYSTYLYGNKSLKMIHNNLLHSDGKKILLLADSFANVVSPFLAIGIGNIDVLDLQYFNGSIKSYIKKSKPDMVVIIYSPISLLYGDRFNYN